MLYPLFVLWFPFQHLNVFPIAALADDGKFLLAARKCRRPTCTDYIISLDADDMSNGSSTYVGKLRCTLNQALWPLLFQSFVLRAKVSYLFLPLWLDQIFWEQSSQSMMASHLMQVQKLQKVAPLGWWIWSKFHPGSPLVTIQWPTFHMN